MSYYDHKGMYCQDGKSFTGKQMVNCPKCGKHIAVNKNGTVVRHNRWFNRFSKCEMSGKQLGEALK